MSGPTEEEIRTEAYQLWKFAGEPACKMIGFGTKPRIQGAVRAGRSDPVMTDNLPI
jgi:hypothetical protein